MSPSKALFASPALALIVLAGCQSDAPSAVHPSEVEQASASVEQAEQPGPVQTPPDMNPAIITPLSGEAAKKARLPLNQIVAQSPVPDYLAKAEAAGDEQKNESWDAGLEAQKAYVRGRQLLRQGQHAEAVQAFERARKAAPDHPRILKSLGRTWLASGNGVRAIKYLRQAIEQAPQDPATLLLLGQFASEQDQLEKASTLLYRAWQHARNNDAADPALVPLVRYHLGKVLSRRGFAQAATKQLRAYLDRPDARRTTESGRQLAMRQQQRGRTWQQVGDLHMQLGDPEAALNAYDEAAAAGLDQRLALVKRQAYAHLLLEQRDEAVALVLRELEKPGQRRDIAGLVRYLAQQGVGADRLAERMKRLYRDQDEQTGLALAVAELLPPQAGRSFLVSHLRDHPGQQRAFARLLEDYLLPADGDRDPQTLRTAAEAVARLMEASPDQAGRYARALIERVADSAALAETLGQMDQAGSALALLRGLALEAAGQTDAAKQALKAATEADAPVRQARLDYARLLIEEGELDQARAALEPVADSDKPAIIRLRLEMLRRMGQREEALALIEELIDQQNPTPPELVRDKAQLLQMMGRVGEAEAFLQNAINRQPEEPGLYAALLQLYNQSPGEGDNEVQKRQRLIQRMLRNIPESRLARMIRSQYLVEFGRHEQAEQILQQLLEDEPRDWEALGLLLEIYRESDRTDEAEALLEQKLKDYPQDQQLLSVAQQYYRAAEQPERFREVAERWLLQQPETPGRDVSLAQLYLQTDNADRALEAAKRALEGKPDDPLPAAQLLWRAALATEKPAEAEKAIKQAIENYPDHAADLQHELSLAYQHQDRDEDAERLLQQILEQNPDHAPANNGLGYAWADQGRNLQQAEGMIDKALAEEEDSAAYLDSKGWVLYKQGKFEEAVQWLQRARSQETGDYPVIVDHLGDALYRMGETQQAVQRWRDSLRMLKDMDRGPVPDPELQGLADRIQKKLQAAEQDEAAPVAPVADDAQAPAPEQEDEAGNAKDQPGQAGDDVPANPPVPDGVGMRHSGGPAAA